MTARRLLLLAVLAAGFGFYAPTIGYWFFYDDFWFLHASQSTFIGGYVFDAFNYRQEGPVPELLYRPLYLTSFRLMYEAFGLHAWAYHLTNVLLHLGSAVLLWQIALKITRRPAIAMIAALIFVLHPTYAVAVAFVTNGIDVISTFAYLGSLWLFLRYLDGGAAGRWWYVGSLLMCVAALLLHPETGYLPGLLVLSYLLFGMKSLQELRSRRAWAQFVPFAVVGIGFVVVQQLARQTNDLVSTFSLGPHVAENYARFAALGLNPYRAPASRNPFLNDTADPFEWAVLVPALCGVVAVGALLWSERRRPGAGVFALAWLVMALLPLCMWTYGAAPRKLYGAGPALALAIAILFVSCWDLICARFQAGTCLLAPAAFALVTASGVLMGVRVVQISNEFGSQAQSYHDLVQNVRAIQPPIPEGSRLYLVNVPWPLIFLGGDSAGFISALQLYYENVEIFAVVDEGQLPGLPDPPRANDVIVRLPCPPTCQPLIGTTGAGQ